MPHPSQRGAGSARILKGLVASAVSGRRFTGGIPRAYQLYATGSIPDGFLLENEISLTPPPEGVEEGTPVRGSGPASHQPTLSRWQITELLTSDNRPNPCRPWRTQVPLGPRWGQPSLSPVAAAGTLLETRMLAASQQKPRIVGSTAWAANSPTRQGQSQDDTCEAALGLQAQRRSHIPFSTRLHSSHVANSRLANQVLVPHRALSAGASGGAVAAQVSAMPQSSHLVPSATSAKPVPMLPTVQELDALFRSRPTALGVGANPTVVVVPSTGFSGMMLSALGYYGKESQLIRGARALYSQCQKRADDEAFMGALGLEKGFRASHALLVLHTWLCLARLRSEDANADAAEVGQTVYDLFNHDCEKRVVAAGVTVLVSKWMKELEKNFYGACMAYDAAQKPEAPRDALESALWRNVLQDGEAYTDRSTPVDAAASRALARYVRLQLASLALTGSDAFMTGNIAFTAAT